MAAILLLAGSLVPAAPGEANLKRFEYQQILMGVPVKILVYSADESLANAAVHAAFDRIRQLNLIFSDYDDDSEIDALVPHIGPGPSGPRQPRIGVRAGRFTRTVAPLGRGFRCDGRPAGQLVAQGAPDQAAAERPIAGGRPEAGWIPVDSAR